MIVVFEMCRGTVPLCVALHFTLSIGGFWFENMQSILVLQVPLVDDTWVDIDCDCVAHPLMRVPVFSMNPMIPPTVHAPPG